MLTRLSVTGMNLIETQRSIMKQLITAAVVAITLLASPLSEAKNFRGQYFQCLKEKPIEYPGTIFDAATDSETLASLGINLDTLVTAVTLADPAIAEALQADGNLTVFAPTSEAFAALPDYVFNGLVGDQATLTAVLQYHVIGKRFDPRRAFFPRKINTLLGSDLFFYLDKGKPMVNQSSFVTGCTGVKTTNGTVWVIDSVLLPQF
ncbi:Fasciclin domain-containing protein [Thalassotalea agarivorans]|uniref:Fasciclin domain-containing protein n=2 Tax=Thalassotalea agarivorans TaxID=349064 RepID=A0A1I0BIE5_THASX|nr:Fasciclin domain-containing protein [Thalassotalea agarivorans]